MAAKFPAPPVRTPFWDPVNPKTISRPWINWFQQLGDAITAAATVTGGTIPSSPSATFIGFDLITSGTNTSATMTVGTGSSMGASGSGVINATEINGIPITGALTHAGQIPISQPGNTSAVWSDPLVQGIQADGTTASTINPVLISGKGADGNQHDALTDNSGKLLIGNLPSSTGAQPSANSTSVVLASDQQLNTSIQDTMGEALLSTENSLNVHLKTQEMFNTDSVGNIGVNIQGTVPASLVSSVPLNIGTSALPANASQEQGGNLAILVQQTRNDAQTFDLLAQILAAIQYQNILLAAAFGQQIDSPDGVSSTLIQ